MKVLVTGGTGFVGSHAVEALVEAGHQVRLFARSRDKAARVMAQRGVALPEVALGDMTDVASIAAALEGCDACLHAAAEVEISRTRDVFASNVAGNRNVLGAALERGLDPVVYTSSIATMFPPPGPVMTVDDPIVNLETDYGRSKADGERYVREVQDMGLPLVSVYPTGVYGPEDPGLGATLVGLRARLRFGWMKTAGGSGCVDVRDLARILAACFEPGRGPRRYMAGGHFLTWMEEADLCADIVGRRVLRIPAPPPLVRGIGHTVDLVKRIAPSFDYPLTYEAALFATRFVPADSSRTTRELGLEFRPPRETFADAIQWLLDSGALHPRWAPKLTKRGRV